MKRATERRDAGRPRGAAIEHIVLTCVLEELGQHGFEGLSVDRIARAAEVNKTSIYRRWPTREALVAATLEHVLVNAEASLVDTGSLRGDLEAMAQVVVQLFSSREGVALARAAIAATSAPELAALATQKLASAAGGAADLVRRARARKEWRSTAAPEVVFAMLVGAVLHRTLLEHQSVDAQWLKVLLDVTCRGVA